MSGLFHQELLLGSVILIAIIGQYLWAKVHPVIGLVFTYFSIISIPKIIIPRLFWPGADLAVVAAFEGQVSQSLLYFWLILAGFLLSPKLKWKEFFFLLAGLDTAVMGIRYANGLNEPYFLLNNPAIDASFISCVLPFYFAYIEKHPFTSKFIKAFAIYTIIILFLTKSSAGVLGAGLACGVYYLAKEGFKRGPMIIGFSLSMVAAMIGYITQKQVLFNGSGRYEIWAMAFDFWKENLNHLFGAGIGTFQMYGPTLQIAMALKQPVMPEGIEAFGWMHNDWLQILFEAGIVGLAITILCYLFLLYKARRAPAYFTALTVYGAIAVFQMPLRWEIFASFGMFLALNTLLRKADE